MTYNPRTHHRFCDVCGSRSLDRSYYTYLPAHRKRVQHICSVCIAHGAYWCMICQKIHAKRADCPQLPLPMMG